MKIEKETADSLYTFADEEGIIVTEFDLEETKSCSAQAPSGQCYIGLDTHFESHAEERVHLAHEIGHCVYGAFYNMYSPFDTRGKYERQADKWAIEALVSMKEFKKGIREGCVEPWQIAEKFNITDEFAVTVMKYYFEKMGYVH